MFQTFRYHFRLLCLQNQKRTLEDEYARKIKALEPRNHEAKEALISELFFERDMLEDSIYSLVSGRMLELADAYLIPRPKFNAKSSYWTRSEITGGYRLSETAIAELRSSIRKEQKERHEQGLMWLAGLTGIIGALSGLFSILN